MKYFLLLLFLVCAGTIRAQNQTPAQIRQQMAKIRQSTNWSDPAAAKKANEEIKKLARQMMTSGKPNNLQGQTDVPKEGEASKAGSDDQMKLWEQMWSSIRKGENADIDLAKPLREEIVQEYKDDDDPTIKSPDWLQFMPYLLINVSMPGVQAVIGQMPLFRGIKILVITCEKSGTPVNLNDILLKAKDYPLEELHIVNFGTGVTRLPANIGDFSKLSTLDLCNNHISELPASVSKLSRLDSLTVDVNPISTLLPVVSSLKNLKKIEIIKTGIPDAEIAQIQQMIPNCQIQKK